MWGFPHTSLKRCMRETLLDCTVSELKPIFKTVVDA